VWTGRSNLDELKARLQFTMYRVTREDVAGELPPIERVLHKIDMSATQAREYAKLERVLGPRALKGDDTNAALRTLVSQVSTYKLAALVERTTSYVENEQKVVVFATFHDTLKQAVGALKKALPGVDIYDAGGYLPSVQRQSAIQSWRERPRGAVLCANMLSSGTGIDLSPATASIFLELGWVPADVLQAEARHASVHAARSSPPVVEYLLARQTVDEAMALKVIGKIETIQSSVGADLQSTGLRDTIADAGLVDESALGLRDESDSVVGAALDDLRARLAGITTEIRDADDEEEAEDADAEDEATTEEEEA
jgi:hypothetical protein